MSSVELLLGIARQIYAFCFEKNSGVLALLRVKLNSMTALATPCASGMQGEAKLDWETLWEELKLWF
jgi:hypothetical protein